MGDATPDSLTPTAKVILGMLEKEPRSGYEIKQIVDDSTRFFWAASYGQIYPELKRLAKAGLVKGTDAARDGRERTVYRLTAKGKRALAEWRSREPETYELRDEGMLKLFFSGTEGPERAAEAARQRAAHSAGVAAQLREVEKRVEGKDLASYAVLRYGIELNEWIAEWFERSAEALEAGDAEALLLEGAKA